MIVDVNTFIGAFPYRPVPGHDPDDLLAVLDRHGIAEAWVSYLPAVFWRDPTLGNPILFRAAVEQPRFKPVPAIHPGFPNWQSGLVEARAHGAPCVRADPTFYGLPPAGREMLELAEALGEAGLPLLTSVRLEDGRQRHPNDGTSDLPAAAVRTLIRAHPRLRILVTHADREFVEQVHFGSTPEEAARILWDICWIWGPPEDHLAGVIDSVGVERFTFGTGTPLRLAETTVAKLDLLELSPAQRAAIERGNLERWLRSS
jgi:hypothetical protein